VKRLHAVSVAAALVLSATSGQVTAARIPDPIVTTTTQVGRVRSSQVYLDVSPQGSQASTVPLDVLRRIPKDKTKRCPKWEPLIRKAGLPVQVFSYIAWRESRCNPKSVNAKWKNGKIVWTLNSDGSYDSGLMQINSSWKTVTANTCGAKFGDLRVLLSPTCNVKVATVLYAKGKGLGNWGF
jgi:hypothetical protein